MAAQVLTQLESAGHDLPSGGRCIGVRHAGSVEKFQYLLIKKSDFSNLGLTFRLHADRRPIRERLYNPIVRDEFRMMQRFPQFDRRSGKDRRARPTSPFSLSSLRGSRQHARRKEDKPIYYLVDRYNVCSILLVVAVLTLSVADAFFTLQLVSMGARELNPVMDFFLRYGPLPFLWAKYIFTAAGVTALLMLKNYPVFNGRMTVKVVLMAIPVMYAVLIVYELVLTQ